MIIESKAGLVESGISALPVIVSGLIFIDRSQVPNQAELAALEKQANETYARIRNGHIQGSEDVPTERKGKKLYSYVNHFNRLIREEPESDNYVD